MSEVSEKLTRAYHEGEVLRETEAAAEQRRLQEDAEYWKVKSRAEYGDDLSAELATKTSQEALVAAARSGSKQTYVKAGSRSKEPQHYVTHGSHLYGVDDPGFGASVRQAATTQRAQELRGEGYDALAVRIRRPGERHQDTSYVEPGGWHRRGGNGGGYTDPPYDEYGILVRTGPQDGPLDPHSVSPNAEIVG